MAQRPGFSRPRAGATPSFVELEKKKQEELRSFGHHFGPNLAAQLT